MTACTFSACDNFECMKNFVDDLVVTCDEIADTPECANQSISNKFAIFNSIKNY